LTVWRFTSFSGGARERKESFRWNAHRRFGKKTYRAYLKFFEVAERKRRWNIVGRDETAHAGLYRAMIELD